MSATAYPARTAIRLKASTVQRVCLIDISSPTVKSSSPKSLSTCP